MGCDIGKGVTRMLTPSSQQIDFVRAVGGTIISPLAQAGVFTPQPTQYQYGGVPPPQYPYAASGGGQYGGYGGLDPQTLINQGLGTQTAPTTKRKNQQKTILMIGGAIVVGAAVIMLMPKTSSSAFERRANSEQARQDRMRL